MGTNVLYITLWSYLQTKITMTWLQKKFNKYEEGERRKGKYKCSKCDFSTDCMFCASRHKHE